MAAALALCDENDTIVVMQGHVETIIASLVVNVDGVSIVGVGRGDKMPQIKYNLAAAEISVTADNVLFYGLRLTADVPDVLVGIEIEDAVIGCTVSGCKFDVVTTGTDEFAVCIRTNDATNFAIIEDCEGDMGLGNAVAAVSFTKDTDGSIVRRCYFQGDYSTAVIEGITTLSTKLLIEDNLLINGAIDALNTEPAIELVTASSGVVRRNDIACNLATMLASVAADGVVLFQNFYNEDVTGTGTVFGTPSADG
jgi:hypothetical protein